MNIIYAQGLLSRFQKLCDPKKPLPPQFKQLFIPSTFKKDELVERTSWEGRFSWICSLGSSSKDEDQKIKRVFCEALKAVNQNRQALQSFPVGFRMALYRALNGEGSLDQNNSYPPPPSISSSNPLLDQIKQDQDNRALEMETQKNLEKLKIQKLTFLKSLPHLPKLDQKSLSIFFGITDPKEMGDLNEVVQFLHQRHLVDSQFAQKKLLLEDGLLNQSITQKGVGGVVYCERIRATQFTDTVQSLQVNEKWMLCGHYGKKTSPSEVMSQLFKIIDIKKLTNLTLPDKIKNLPDPEQFVDKQLKQIRQELEKSLPEICKFLNHPDLQFLLRDPSRTLSPGISSRCPDLLKWGIESWQKEGLIGDAMEFVSDGEIREGILWLLDHQKDLLDPLQQKQFLDQMEVKIKDNLKDKFAKGKELTQEVRELCFEEILNSIPKDFVNLFENDLFSDNGLCWLEFEKQRNGKYTVLIYPSGPAIQFHQKQGNKIQWPMRLVDIEEDKLNKEFFQRVLFHQNDPKSDKKSTSSAENFYTGVIAYLKGTPDLTHEEDWRVIDSKKGRSIDHIMSYLAGAKEISPSDFLDMRLEALVCFCQPYLTQNGLQLKGVDPTIQKVLKKSIKVLVEEAKNLNNPSILERVLATECEINEALTTTQEKITDVKSQLLNVPSLVAQQVRTVCIKMGVTTHQLDQIKALLDWGIGQETAELFHQIQQALGPLDTVSSPQQSSQGVQRTWSGRGRLAKFLFSAHLRMTLRALTILMIVTRLSYSSMLAVLFRSLIEKGINWAIPTRAKLWFSEVMKILSAKFAEMTLTLILRSLLSKELTESLLALRTTTQSLAKTVLGTQTINLQFDSTKKSFQTSPVKVEIEEKKDLPDITQSDVTPSEEKFSDAINRLIDKTPDVISSSNIKDVLVIWEKNIRAIMGPNFKKREIEGSSLAWVYLNQQINRLPIPHPYQKGIWDEIALSDIVSCLELFSNFSILLARDGGGRSDAETSKKLILFSLTAIMDKLARRCSDSYLGDTPIDVSHILNNIKYLTFTTPESLERVKSIIAYFLPDVEWSCLPSSEEIQKRFKNSLFSGALEFLSEKDYSFFGDLFKRVEIRQKFIDKGIFVDYPEGDRKNLFLGLAASDFVNNFFPRSLTLLRLHCFLTKGLYSTEKLGLIKTPKNYDKIEETWFSFFDEKIEQIPNIIKTGINTFGNGVGKGVTKSSRAIKGHFSHPYDQSYEMVKEPPKLREDRIIDLEPEDRIIRALSQLKKEKGVDFRALNGRVFFQGELERQLQNSSQVAYVIGELLTEIYKERKIDHCCNEFLIFSIHLKKYCGKYAPQHLHRFPDFSAIFQDSAIVKDEMLNHKCQVLELFSFPSPPFPLSSQEHQRAIYLTYSLILTGGYYPDPKIQDIYNQCLLNWWPYLKTVQVDSQLKISILKSLGFLCDDKDEKDFTLDFAKGALIYKGSPVDFPLIMRAKKDLHPFTHSYDPVKMVDGRLEASGDFSITLDGNSTVRKKINGVDYSYLSSLLNSNLPEKLVKTFDYVWLEETKNPKKKILIKTYAGVEINLLLQKDPGSQDKFFITEIEENNERLIILPEEIVSSHLAPLSRFCPVEEILVFGGSSHFQKIDIPSYDLSFEIKLMPDGQLKAFSKSFQGYFIAPQQSCPGLKDFASYLLLENEQGKKKVIVPEGQLIESLVWRFAVGCGGVANLAHPWIKILIDKAGGSVKPKQDQEVKKTYLSYDMDDQGSFTSEQPEALIHLIIFSLIQGKNIRALEVCQSIEKLSKLMPLPLTLDQLLFPLVIIPEEIVPEISLIRQKLFSALEQNRLVHPIDTSNSTKNSEKSEDFLPLMHSVFAAILLKDLKHPQKGTDPRNWLSSRQEWFLFQRLFFHLTQIIQGNGKSSNEKFSYALSLGWENLLDLVGIDSELIKRYKELKMTLDKKDHLLSRSIHTLVDIQRTPSLLNVTTGNQNQKVGENVVFSMIYRNIQDYSRYFLVKVDLKKFEHGDVYKDYQFVGLPNEIQITEYFLNKYAIARGEKTAKGKKGLQEILPLIKGGWCPHSERLIEYLEAIVDNPWLFPSSGDFLRRFRYGKTHEPVLKTLFSDLDQCLLKWKLLKGGKKWVNEKIYAMIDTHTLDKRIALDLSLPIGRGTISLLETTLHWGTKVYNWHMSQTESVVPRDKPQGHSSINYNHLVKEERDIDAFFDCLFQISFIKEGQLPKKQVKSLSIDGKDPLKVDRLNRVNQSLKDYYQRQGEEGQVIRLKDLQSIYELYANATNCHTSFKQQLDNDLKSLLDLINSNIKSAPITFKDLKRCFLKGDFSDLNRLQVIPQNLFENLELYVAHYLMRYTRLQQLTRVIQLMEELIALEEGTQSQLYGTKLEQLAEELLSRRAFDFEKTPVPLLRRFLCFEFVSNKRLWKKQVEAILKVHVDHPKDGKVLELLPGLGKTDCIGPTINSLFANGFSLVCNVFPDSLFETNVKAIVKHGNEIYDQSTNVLHFDRSQSLKQENLEAILDLLEGAIKEGETINFIKNDALALQLNFIDLLYRARHSHPRAKKNFEGRLMAFQKILLLFKRVGKLVGDEAHELLKITDELNYPVGKSSTITSKHYRVAEDCMRIMVGDPNVLTRFRRNEMNQISMDEYLNIFIPKVAQQLSEREYFKFDSDQKKAFIDYVSGHTTKIPSWIKDHPLYNEIALVKGMLTLLLPKFVLPETVNVSFGGSNEKDNGEYARPYDGNTNPIETSTIKSPWEALVKTFTMFICNGLKKDQVVRVVKSLAAKAEVEKTNRKIDIKQTHSYQFFQKLFPGFDLMNFNSSQVTQEMQINVEIIFCYVRFFVYRDIEFWGKNIRGTSLNFVSMFVDDSYFHTGTPYNQETYHPDLKILSDPGTVGEALHIINQKNPGKGIHLLKASEPLAILREVLPTFFSKGSKFSALIDGGAQFKGLTNSQVVHEMAEFAKVHRPDIKGIHHFRKDNQGKDQLFTLSIETRKEIPYERCSFKDEQCWSYYDESHGFGANILQRFNGRGLNLINEKHLLYRLLQEAFRMRGLKVTKKLLGFGGLETLSDLERENLENTQTIEFAMTEHVKQSIAGQNMPTLDQLINFATENEEFLSENNLQSYWDKIHDLIRRTAFDKILNVKSFDEMLKLFEIFEDQLVSTASHEPKELFGRIDSSIPLENGIELIKKKAVNLIEEMAFSAQEKQLIMDKINKIPPPLLPLTMTISSDGEETQLHLDDDWNRQVSQDLRQTQEQDLENDLQNENELKTQDRLQVAPKDMYREIDWTRAIDPRSLDWLTFESLKDQSLYSWVAQSRLFKKSLPFFFKLGSLFEVSNDSRLCKIAPYFDPRIWVTNNFLPQLNIEHSVEVGSDQQRDLFEVLIHLEEEGTGSLQIGSVQRDDPDEVRIKLEENRTGALQIVSMGCLSVKDAKVWREKLGQMKKEGKPKNTKVILYDISLRVIVAGDELDINVLRNLPDLSLLEAQLKFINGDTDYTQTQSLHLKGWMKKDKSLKKAYRVIHKQRGLKPIEGSEMESILYDLKSIPLEERV